MTIKTRNHAWVSANRLRLLTGIGVLAAIFAGAATKNDWGVLCSFQAWVISFTCPLGYLEASLASRNLLPELWLGVGFVVLSLVLLGRYFCAWVCPGALMQRIFGQKQPLKPTSNSVDPEVQSGWPAYSSYAVLAGALLSSFVFGFPVFCLFCPVGLAFSILFALKRLFSVTEPSWELLVLPALLAVEFLVFKSWCRSLCPLGALLRMVSWFNRTARPIVSDSECFTYNGTNCQLCARACPEGLNPATELARADTHKPLPACTKCLECYDRCPVKAIKLV